MVGRHLVNPTREYRWMLEGRGSYRSISSVEFRVRGGVVERRVTRLGKELDWFPAPEEGFMSDLDLLIEHVEARFPLDARWWEDEGVLNLTQKIDRRETRREFGKDSPASWQEANLSLRDDEIVLMSVSSESNDDRDALTHRSVGTYGLDEEGIEIACRWVAWATMPPNPSAGRRHHRP